MGTLEALENLSLYLESEKIWYRKNYNIKFETFYKTGGNVNTYICPNSVSDLIKATKYLIQKKIEFKTIGFTSNVLLFDEIEYSVILSTKNVIGIEIADGYIDVEGGYSLQDFVRVAVIHSAKGFEGLEGIPGSVGGGVFMNAGAYGYSIADKIISVEYIDEAGNIKTATKEMCKFNYRTSTFKGTRNIITRVRFKIETGDQEEIANKIETFHIARHSYQEFCYPNLGSMFSVNGNFYQEIIRNETKLYNAVFILTKLLYKNPIAKFFNRKRPNNTPLNWLLAKKINVNNYTPSKKSMNIFINRGISPIEDSLDYMIEIKHRLGSRFHIENELILEPSVAIKPEFIETYKKIKANLIN